MAIEGTHSFITFYVCLIYGLSSFFLVGLSLCEMIRGGNGWGVEILGAFGKYWRFWLMCGWFGFVIWREMIVIFIVFSFRAHTKI